MREKRGGKRSNNHRRQSDYYKLQHATPHGKGHGSASRWTVECQIWPLDGITRVALMVQAPPTRCGMLNTR